MMMAKALSKSSRAIGLNGNVTLAILGATMRIQYKKACLHAGLQGLGASDLQQYDGGAVQVELVHMAHER